MHVQLLFRLLLFLQQKIVSTNVQSLMLRGTNLTRGHKDDLASTFEAFFTPRKTRTRCVYASESEFQCFIMHNAKTCIPAFFFSSFFLA